MPQQNTNKETFSTITSQHGDRLPIDLRKTIWFFIAFLAIGITACAIYADAWKSFAIYILWILTSLVFGIVIGFLFGIPKVLQTNSYATGNINKSDSHNQSPVELYNYKQQPNTNLTEISDWLTKIIVGLGLINLKKIPVYVTEVATWMSSGIDRTDPTMELAFSTAVVLGYSILGFLFGYLTTRLFLAGAFYRADTNPINALVAQTKSNKASIDRLDANQNVIQEKIYPQRENKAKTIDGAESQPVETAADNSEAAEKLKTLIEMGTQYLQISAEDWGERVRLKDKAASDLGNFILENHIPKNVITREILDHHNEGVLIGLATVIAFRPEPGDVERIISTGGNATRRHVRYRVLLAINTLAQRNLVTELQKTKLIYLINSYRINADQPLLNMIETTLSFMTRFDFK